MAWLPRRQKPFSAAFRLLSASIRKLAEVTTRLAVGDALADLDVAAAALAELDLARLEAAFALVDEDGLPAAGVDHRALGNGQHRLAAAGVDLGIDIHVGQQHAVGIGQFDRGCARCASPC